MLGTSVVDHFDLGKGKIINHEGHEVTRRKHLSIEPIETPAALPGTGCQIEPLPQVIGASFFLFGRAQGWVRMR